MNRDGYEREIKLNVGDLIIQCLVAVEDYTEGDYYNPSEGGGVELIEVKYISGDIGELLSKEIDWEYIEQACTEQIYI